MELTLVAISILLSFPAVGSQHSEYAGVSIQHTIFLRIAFDRIVKQYPACQRFQCTVSETGFYIDKAKSFKKLEI